MFVTFYTCNTRQTQLANRIMYARCAYVALPRKRIRYDIAQAGVQCGISIFLLHPHGIVRQQSFIIKTRTYNRHV